MRRAGSTVVAVLSVLAVWLVVPTPGQAGEISISMGVGFAVGGAHFRLAWTSGGYVPYYYRVEAPLHYPGYVCSQHCYVRGGHHYHAPACPVVRYHFTYYAYAPPPPPAHLHHGHHGHRHGHRHVAGHHHHVGHHYYDSGHRHGGRRHGGHHHQAYRSHGRRDYDGDRQYGRSGAHKKGYRRDGGHKGSRKGHAPGAARRTRPPRP